MPAAPSPTEQLAAMLSANNSAALPPVPDASEGNPLARWFSNGGVSGMLGMAPAYQQIAENQASADAAPDLKSKLAILLQNPVAGALGVDAPIRAYHGSPYSFDKFDPSKIGTGEGAQAYGHGLYFAGNEGVARSYRDALSGDLSYGGERIGDLATAQGIPNALHSASQMRIDVLDNGMSPADALAKEIEGRRRLASVWREDAAKMSATPPDPNWGTLGTDDIAKDFHQKAQQHTAVADWLSSLDPAKLEKQAGHMYEVALHADPASLLDWDKPLSAHSEQAQATLSSLGFTPNPPGMAAGAVPRRGPIVLPEPTGAEIYRRLAGGDFGGKQVGAADTLNQAGIPGIQYLDAGSRNVPATSYLIKSKAGNWSSQLYDDLSQAQAHLPGYQANHFPDAAIEPVQNNISRNYVMFDPSRIEIMRKYGLLAGMLGGGAAAAGGDQQ